MLLTGLSDTVYGSEIQGCIRPNVNSGMNYTT